MILQTLFDPLSLAVLGIREPPPGADRRTPA